MNTDITNQPSILRLGQISYERACRRTGVTLPWVEVEPFTQQYWEELAAAAIKRASVPDILAHLGLEDTPENRDLCRVKT